ncbi:DUF1566 domain-containing protein, partial [Myxococcota bacterium]|nr:DUF1566 domain-containing protein [Myxococcota bacterium]
AIDRSVFVNSPSRFQQIYDMWWIECVWSATDYAGDSSVAWALMVNSGDISEGSGLEYHSHDKDAVGWDGCYARCVRRSDTTDTHSRFVAAEPVSGEPIVGDRVTGLIWQGCSAGQSGADCSGDAEFIDWASALAYCQSLTWGGYNDWRLPNIREISSIIDGSRTLPAINTGVFPGTPYYGPVTNNNAGQYWSSTARSYNSFALYADFTFGFTHFYEQPEGRHVRCVH